MNNPKNTDWYKNPNSPMFNKAVDNYDTCVKLMNRYGSKAAAREFIEGLITFTREDALYWFYMSIDLLYKLEYVLNVSDFTSCDEYMNFLYKSTFPAR